MIAKLFGIRKEAEPPKRIDWWIDLFQNPPTIRTKRLVLRRLEPSDAPGIYETDSDEEICHMSLAMHLTNPQEAIELVDRFRSDSSRGYPAPLAVTLKETGQFIGTCGVTNVETQAQILRLGFAYIRTSWNQGYGTEALQATVQYLMENTEAFRLECHCFPGNQASRRIMEKSGMTYEGVLRQIQMSPYGRHDCCVYSILRPEWEASLLNVRQS